MSAELAIDVRRLRVALGDQPVLRGVDLAVERGTRVALVGPNGAGKSTLLRVMAGLIRPNAGEVRVDGSSLRTDPWHVRRSVGFVGHQTMLHPNLTARENLIAFSRLYGLDHVAERVEDALRQFGLVARAESRASTFSRGMLQRLALARSLLHDPIVLLLDEAETGLDARAHDWLLSVLGERDDARSVVLASHDLSFVREVADEVVFLRSGRVVGRIPTVTLDPAELRERYADAMAAPPTSRPGRAVGVAG
jgi:heme exporter protein A